MFALHNVEGVALGFGDALLLSGDIATVRRIELAAL
jgi:hypothetical protein